MKKWIGLDRWFETLNRLYHSPENDKAIEALKKRLNVLTETAKNLKQIYESQGGARLPLHARSLFHHPLSLIKSEQTFVMSQIHELSEEGDSRKSKKRT